MRTKLLIATLCAVLPGFLLEIATAAEIPIQSVVSVSRQRGSTAPKQGMPHQQRTESDGQSLLHQAQAAMLRHYTVSAQVFQKSHILSIDVIGLGQYSEQRSNQGVRFRLEINLQTQDDKLASGLLQVCDGDHLWNYRKLRGQESLSCVDLATFQQRLDEKGVRAPLRPLDAWPGVGGLSELLASFDRAFLFDTPEGVELQAHFPAWKIEGHWRPEMLARAVPEHKEEIEQGRGVALEDLPKHLPNRIILFLGKEDLFPYSIVYYRLDGNTATVKAGPNDPPMVRINLTNVRFNQQVNAAQFVYRPNLPCTDQTEQLLQRLGLNR